MDSQKIFLISQRRFGKTSLVKEVLQEIRKRKTKTIYIDIEGISTYKKFLNTYLGALIKEYTTIDKIFDFAKRLLPSIRFDINLDETGKPSLSLGYKPSDPNLDEIAAKIYELPGKIAKSHSMVIAFDEFQEILGLNGGQIEAALRSAIQHQRNVGYIFAGSKRHILMDMAMLADRPFYKIGPVMHLEKISEGTFKEFIREKFHRTKVKISKEAISKIIRSAENIPYFVQMISHELWDFAVTNKKAITEEGIEFVFDELIRQYNQNFHELWTKLISAKKHLLRAIAYKGGRNLLSKESLAENELGYPSSVQRTLGLLVSDGILDKVDGEYFIVDILFREWIKKYTE